MRGVEWTENEGVWTAEIGPYSLVVYLGSPLDFGEAPAWRWFVRWVEDGQRYEDSGTADGESPASAQTAAVNAAVSLLCEALARVPCEGPESIGVRHEDGCPLDIDEAVKVAGPDACIALGCALLAAGVRAREGR